MLRMNRKTTIASLARQLEKNSLPERSDNIDLFDGLDTPTTLYFQYLKTKQLHLLLKDIDAFVTKYHPNINYILLGLAKLGELTLVSQVLRKYNGNIAYAMRGIAMFQPQLIDAFVKQHFSSAFPIPDAVLRELIIGAAFRRHRLELQHWFKVGNVKNDPQYKAWMLDAAIEGAGIRGDEEFIYHLHSQGGKIGYAVRGLALSDNEELLEHFISQNYQDYLTYALQGAAIGNDGGLLSQLMTDKYNSIPSIMLGLGLGGQLSMLGKLTAFKQSFRYAVLGAMVGGHYEMVNHILNDAQGDELGILYRYVAKGALEYGLENKKIATHTINAIRKEHQLGVMQAINQAVPAEIIQPRAQFFNLPANPVVNRQSRSCFATLLHIMSFVASSLSAMFMIFALPFTCCKAGEANPPRRMLSSRGGSSSHF